LEEAVGDVGLALVGEEARKVAEQRRVPRPLQEVHEDHPALVLLRPKASPVALLSGAPRPAAPRGGSGAARGWGVRAP